MLYVVISLFFLLILLLNAQEVNKCSSNKWHPIIFIVMFPILLIISVIIAVMIPVGNVLQLIVGVILKLKYGNEFGGMVKGTDLSMGCNKRKYSFIKVFLIVEYNKAVAKKTVFEYTMELMQRSCAQKKLHKKFFTSLEQCLGYLFYRKIDLTMSDCVRRMPLSENVVDKCELLRVLKSFMFGPLPLDDKALWDMHVGTQPLKWKSHPNPNIEYYPMVVRIHHVIADGTTLVKHLKILFEDESSEIKFESEVAINLESKKKSFVQNIWLLFDIFMLFTSAMFITLVLRGHDRNDLHGKPFGDEDTFYFATDEDGEYFKKVKKIKKLHGSITFPEVLISAYSASLNEYYQKYCTHCPEKVTVSYPVVPDPHLVRRIRSGQIDSNISVATNNFTFLQMFLPVDISKNKNFDKNSPLTSRLNIIKKEIDLLKDSAELQLSYVLINIILGSLPIWFATKFLKSIQNTAACSFLPGPPKLKYCENIYEIADSLFWIPHIAQLGIGITTITYDNRLAVGINSNSDIAEQSRAEEVIKNFLKYIDVMEEEVDRLYCKNHVD